MGATKFMPHGYAQLCNVAVGRGVVLCDGRQIL